MNVHMKQGNTIKVRTRAGLRRVVAGIPGGDVIDHFVTGLYSLPPGSSVTVHVPPQEPITFRLTDAAPF